MVKKKKSVVTAAAPQAGPDARKTGARSRAGGKQPAKEPTQDAVGPRERIFAAAQRVYAQEGYRGFSMRKVALQAGLSTMASYRHFPDKDHLLHALVVHGFSLFGAAQQRLLQLADPFERLRAGCDVYRNFAQTHPAYFELMFMATDEVKALKMLTPEGAQTMAASFYFTRRVVRDCGAPRETATQEAVSMWAHMHGLIVLQGAGRLAWIDDYDAYFAAEMDRLTDELRSRLRATGHLPGPTGPGRHGTP